MIWIDFLVESDFTLQHKPGKFKKAADFFLRRPIASLPLLLNEGNLMTSSNHAGVNSNFEGLEEEPELVGKDCYFRRPPLGSSGPQDASKTDGE